MFDNPFISEQGRDDLLKEYAGTDDPLYRQEVLGEFVVLEGMAFALPQDSYVEDRWDHADLEHSFHWRGVDHGYSPDPTACLWIAYNKKKNHFIVYQEYKKSKLLIADHSKIINGLEPFHYVNTYSDIDPQVIAEYAAVGLKMAPAAKSDKNSRILRLVTALKTGKLKIARNCTELLSEMQNYYWEQDGNDHLIDALNYGFNNLAIPEEQKAEIKEDPRLSDRSESEWSGQTWDD
jgi:phage terminase large subunit